MYKHCIHKCMDENQKVSWLHLNYVEKMMIANLFKYPMGSFNKYNTKCILEATIVFFLLIECIELCPLVMTTIGK